MKFTLGWRHLQNTRRFSSKQSRVYVQGQLKNDERQYFYYIDHQGMLYLDDARMKNFTSCFKEKKFLKFFFSRLKVNSLANSKEWPYVSPCGGEMNYVRCDDLPVVYQAIINEDDEQPSLSWGDAKGLLSFPLDLSSIAMCPQTGRVYHPAPVRQGGIGLITSKVAIQISNYFVFDSESSTPSGIVWQGKQYLLHNNVLRLLEDRMALGRNSDSLHPD